MFVRSDIVVTETSVGRLNSTKLEHMWRVLKLNGDSVLLGCVYRPPDCKQDESQAGQRLEGLDEHSLGTAGSNGGQLAVPDAVIDRAARDAEQLCRVVERDATTYRQAVEYCLRVLARGTLNLRHAACYGRVRATTLAVSASSNNMFRVR